MEEALRNSYLLDTCNKFLDAKLSPLVNTLVNQGLQQASKTENLGYGEAISFAQPTRAEVLHSGESLKKTEYNNCIAGLLLLYNQLDESHEISQAVNTKEGSFWHAIMHRREQDYWNSKYWFGKVGPHPIYTPLLENAELVAKNLAVKLPSNLRSKKHHWNPKAFVDLVEEEFGSGSTMELLAIQLQVLEWCLLFDHCLSP